jgi:hypothetical protein
MANPVGPVGENAPPSLPATIDRRIAIAGAVLGFGLGLAVGLKLANGMPKTVEVPVRTPCRNCAERERQAATAPAYAPPPPVRDVPMATTPATAPPPDPSSLTGMRTFSPYASAPAGMVDQAAQPAQDDGSVPTG